MSTAPGLAPQPEVPVSTPELVRTPHEPKNRRGWLIVLLGAAAIGLLGWFLWPEAGPSPLTRTPAPAPVRTATVTTGNIVQTVRLSGTTSAERFASLLVPQLRGSRSDTLREGKTFQSPGATYNVQSNAGRSGRSGGSSGSLGSAGGAGGEGQIASTMGQSTGGSAALRSATSRVGGSSTGRRGSSGSSGSSGSGSNATGESGLGSTAGALMGTGFAGGGSSGGGGGSRGGGGGEYMMVLQDVVKPGSHVRKGQQVAEFDREYMMTRLGDYRASVAQMDASFEKLKAEVNVQRVAHKQSIDNAKAALDQARLDLKTIPVLGAIEAERVRLAAEEAEARYKQLLAEVKFVETRNTSQIKTAELELKQAHLELRRAEMNADRMLLKAPIDGLVVMQTMFRGGEMAQIQQGDQLYAGMRFMQIVDTSSMVINASVNQVDADRMRVGSKAQVRFDAFPGLVLPATVHAIGAMTKPGGMRASFVREVPVILKLDKMDPRVIPDLSVSADVEIAAEQNATVAPLASVFREDGKSDSAYVFVRNGQVWERRDVQVGLASNLDIVVRSGLRPGEVVAAERPPDEVLRQKQG